jgi:ribosomal protein S25
MMGMGGKKKLSLKQMERLQTRRDSRSKKEDTAARPPERSSLGILPPDSRNEKIINAIKKMNVLTPYTIATRFNLQISTAKGFLRELEKNGQIKLILGNHSIKIYKTLN